MIKVYNSLSRKKEVFNPSVASLPQGRAKQAKKVNFFVCGPTVYDSPHLGHARTYIVFDAFVKYLRQNGFKVFYLQNITDIDDKIIKRAKEENVPWKALSLRFEKEYLKDMKTIGVDSVDKYARATDYIKEIISQVERLTKKGYAYRLDDGIYFDVAKFKEYGKLSRRTAGQAEDAVSRVDETKGKRNKGDFCLWKLSKAGEPKWPSPFGNGRPGWHIEDTAITEKHFGPQYDIHGGGRDLIFPHHEAEISQMEAISGKKPLTKYWLHTGFLTINGEKMSKSLGNFITIRDFLEKYPPRLLRLLVLKSLYRSPLDYNQKEVEQTERQMERIDEFVSKCKMQSEKGKIAIKNAKLAKDLAAKAEKNFEAAMDDDFNTPLALAAVFGLITGGNKLIAEGKMSGSGAKAILGFLQKVERVFNCLFPDKKTDGIPAVVQGLVQEREQARQRRDWREADRLRLKILGLGYKVDDTVEGPRPKKV